MARNLLADEVEDNKPRNLLAEKSSIKSKPKQSAFEKAALNWNPIEELHKPNPFLGNVANAAIGFGEEAIGLGGQALRFPFEAAGYAGSGFKKSEVPRLTQNVYQGFENLANTPSSIAKYLGSEKYAKKLHLNLNPFGKPEEEESGDVLAQSLPSLVPFGMLGEAGALTGTARTAARMGAGGLFGVSQNQDPLISALLAGALPPAAQKVEQFGEFIGSKGRGKIHEFKEFVKEPRVKELNAKERLEQAIAEHEEAKQLQKSAEIQAAQHGLKTNPEALELETSNKRSALQQAIKKYEEIPEQNLHKMLPVLANPALVPQAENNLAQTQQNLRTRLGEGDVHGENVSQNIVRHFEGTKNPVTGKYKGGVRGEIGKSYNKINKDLKPHEISLPAPIEDSDIQQVDQYLKKSISGKAEIKPDQLERLKQQMLMQIQQSKPPQVVNASDYFTEYRSALKKAKNAYKAAYQKASDITPEQRESYIQQAENFNRQAKGMSQIIEQQIGGEPAKLLAETNKRYATEYAPLHQNPTYQQMLKHGKYDSSLMKALRGTTSGNDILNRYIAQQPELARNILGQEFAHRPQELLNPNRRAEPYINQLPDIQEMIAQQMIETRAVQEAHSQSADLEQEAKRIRESTKELIAQQKVRKSLENETIPKLQYEIQQSEKHLPILKKRAERTSGTKQEIEKRKEEYKIAQENNKNLKNKLAIVGSAIAGVTLGRPLANKISKLFK